MLILPRARRWLVETLDAHGQAGARVADTGFECLPQLFEAELLARTRLAAVDHVPQPPLRQWGLPDDLAGSEPDGITLDNTIFVQRGRERDESLAFHEMVHAVQWSTLGRSRFLAMYGLMLAECGYRDNPLEAMAYELQSHFDSGDLHHDVTAVVERRTLEMLAVFRRRSLGHRLIFLMI